MSKFLSALAKIGLVELDADDRPVEISQRDSRDAEAVPLEPLNNGPAEQVTASVGESAAAQAAPGMTGTGAVESALTDGLQRSLDEIYAAAQIPASPFPAEKLLKILDGLRAMDMATRKAAVLAMDAADEDWAVEDAVSDAHAKIEALQGARRSLGAAVQQAEVKAQQEEAQQEEYQREATASIRKQIADLEALLERELTKVAQERAGIRARLDQTRATAKLDDAHLSEQITRLQEVGDSFGNTMPVNSEQRR